MISKAYFILFCLFWIILLSSIIGNSTEVHEKGHKCRRQHKRKSRTSTKLLTELSAKIILHNSRWLACERSRVWEFTSIAYLSQVLNKTVLTEAFKMQQLFKYIIRVRVTGCIRARDNLADWKTSRSGYILETSVRYLRIVLDLNEIIL